VIPSSGRPAPRSEQAIIAELATLCVSPGYANVIASFCFRDNIVKYSGEGLKADDYLNLHSPNRLNRPEISTLIGLMLKADLDLAPAVPRPIQALLRTDRRTSPRTSACHEYADARRVERGGLEQRH